MYFPNKKLQLFLCGKILFGLGFPTDLHRKEHRLSQIKLFNCPAFTEAEHANRPIFPQISAEKAADFSRF